MELFQTRQEWSLGFCIFIFKVKSIRISNSLCSYPPLMSTPGNRKAHQDGAEQRAEKFLHCYSLKSTLPLGGNTDGNILRTKSVSMSKRAVGVSGFWELKLHCWHAVVSAADTYCRAQEKVITLWLCRCTEHLWVSCWAPKLFFFLMPLFRLTFTHRRAWFNT